MRKRAAGWKLLFDGRNNYGLRGLTFNDFINRGWRIDRGSLFCVKEIKDMGLMTGGHLITLDQYQDFEFSFEWKLSVSGKSGIMYFAMGTRDKPVGFVYSIIDDVHNPDGLKGGPIRRTGRASTISSRPPPTKSSTARTSGTRGRIVVLGNHVEHWLNDAKVVEYNLGSPEFTKQLVASGVKGPAGWGTKFKTSLVILDEGEEVEFRNLRVRRSGMRLRPRRLEREPVKPEDWGPTKDTKMHEKDQFFVPFRVFRGPLSVPLQRSCH
ncbi:MAG: DUF1080 domain-containing protein [Chthoniobacter sp.]